jgi:hypothetical protein
LYSKRDGYLFLGYVPGWAWTAASREGFIIWFKHYPLRTFADQFLKIEQGSAPFDIFPFGITGRTTLMYQTFKCELIKTTLARALVDIKLIFSALIFSAKFRQHRKSYLFQYSLT